MNPIATRVVNTGLDVSTLERMIDELGRGSSTADFLGQIVSSDADGIDFTNGSEQTSIDLIADRERLGMLVQLMYLRALWQTRPEEAVMMARKCADMEHLIVADGTMPELGQFRPADVGA